MADKFDGVIEAVRMKNGQIQSARVFERRGAAFSDWFLLDRKALLNRLQKGQRFVTGTRKEFFGNLFQTGKPVFLVKHGDREFISTNPNASGDELENVPFF